MAVSILINMKLIFDPWCRCFFSWYIRITSWFESRKCINKSLPIPCVMMKLTKLLLFLHSFSANFDGFLLVGSVSCLLDFVKWKPLLLYFFFLPNKSFKRTVNVAFVLRNTTHKYRATCCYWTAINELFLHWKETLVPHDRSERQRIVPNTRSLDWSLRVLYQRIFSTFSFDGSRWKWSTAHVPIECMASRFWMTSQLNGCTKHPPRKITLPSSGLQELAQTIKKN